MSVMSYFVYILRSLKDGTYYYGSTQNLQSRLQQHNAGKVKYTKGHRPYVIHYFEEYTTRHDAILRERFFKSIKGYDWLRANGIIGK